MCASLAGWLPCRRYRRTSKRKAWSSRPEVSLESFPTKKWPMGFGFAANVRHAYICCHDDAVVFEFELAIREVTRAFLTATGCEFIVAYQWRRSAI